MFEIALALCLTLHLPEFVWTEDICKSFLVRVPYAYELNCLL